MYSEGDEVGENCKTILLKSLLLQDITAAIQRQSPGALSHPCCVESQSASHSKTKNKDGLLFYKNCISLIAFGYEERISCSVVTYPLWYFWFWLWSGAFFSLSLYFLPALPLPCTLSLSLSESLWAPFFMLLSSQRDGDNDLNEGGWGKERNWEFVW